MRSRARSISRTVASVASRGRMGDSVNPAPMQRATSRASW